MPRRENIESLEIPFASPNVSKTTCATHQLGPILCAPGDQDGDEVGPVDLGGAGLEPEAVHFALLEVIHVELAHNRDLAIVAVNVPAAHCVYVGRLGNRSAPLCCFRSLFGRCVRLWIYKMAHPPFAPEGVRYNGSYISLFDFLCVRTEFHLYP